MNKMFRKLILVLNVCAVVGLSSCEKVFIVDGENAPEQSDGVARLTLTTRSDDNSDEAFMLQTRIYIFRQSEKCVQMLDINEDDNTATVQLAAGSYRLCAVGGDDLARFTLPTQADATTASIIKLQEGKVMDNFFSKQVSVTLADGDKVSENITLERKVACLNKIEVKDVPADATDVEVTLSSFYGAVQLDGTFPSSPTTDYKVALTKQSDGTTWQAMPQTLLFPSVDTLVFSVLFTTANGVKSYSYTMNEALEANYYYSLSSTYKAQAKLDITLTATNWNEERIIDSDFSDANMTYLPVAGQYCNGYYVVSVNEDARTAVLLSEWILYDIPADKTQGSAGLWKAEVEKQMAALEKPVNITGSWRLPTVDEVKIFTQDPQAVSYNQQGISAVCFCENANKEFGWAYTKKKDETYEFISEVPAKGFADYLRLRPVIDISY